MPVPLGSHSREKELFQIEWILNRINKGSGSPTRLRLRLQVRRASFFFWLAVLSWDRSQAIGSVPDISNPLSGIRAQKTTIPSTLVTKKGSVPPASFGFESFFFKEIFFLFGSLLFYRWISSFKDLAQSRFELWIWSRCPVAKGATATIPQLST